MQSSPPPSSPERTRFQVFTFSNTDQRTLAGLVRTLLLRAGIESNPGPSIKYVCPVCKLQLRNNSTSVQCSSCKQWIHVRKANNCSDLPSVKDYNPTFTCRTCKSPAPAAPPPPSPTPRAAPPPSPPPRPAPKAKSKAKTLNLKILQFNCNGIKNKIDELLTFMSTNDILIAAIQETKLTDKATSPKTPNFSFERKDRGKDKGGGLAFLIHKSIQYRTIPSSHKDPHLETLSIEVGSLTIHNVYIPPAASCATGYTVNVKHLLNDKDTLVLGDFNAHDPLWFSSLQDARGSLLSDEITGSNLAVINDDIPTRRPSNGQDTSPDITLATLDLIPFASWHTEISLGSDHLPIIVTLETDIKPQKARTENSKTLRRPTGRISQILPKKSSKKSLLQEMFTKAKKSSEILSTKLPKKPSQPAESRIFYLKSP